MAKEKKCIFCGKSYIYCPSCKEYSKYPEWMASFDSERCHDLYEAIGGYNIGVKTKDDVKAVLDKHGIVDYSEFSEKLQNKLESMFSTTTVFSESAEESVSVEESQPIIEETVFSENITVEEPDQVEEVKPVEEKYNSQRNRRLRRKNYEKTANTEE